MLGRQTMGRMNLSAAIFVALVAALFLMFYVDTVTAQGGMVSHKGEVLAIDRDARTLTLRLFETDMSYDIRTRGEVTFAYTDMTIVDSCDQVRSFDDIKVGENALITYSEPAMGEPLASTITLAAGPGMLPGQC